ncbi:S-formylglutathione hydrolase [Gloeobacter violaceus]|uniref:S-formylglutathione hydrolase n=1 Tax=Gloeobacter violaceus (strain ATCC 29082 / PCC 7421) TaxID=251221 RepID=Q7ND10_GLOVI|nr:S-formylglutathione hydrolase [Gloeobacter violaceus]BAC92367.1 S-formylglutathione hydrolase [Gloeobacter violaceus PCC 7421]
MRDAPELLSSHRCFGGTVGFYRHHSETCDSPMRFSVFTPPQAAAGPVPVLYFLAGLTCTEENFMVKAGAQRAAARYGLMLVAPDTSPRKTGIPGEDDEWDFGAGAGFYVDATEEPWSLHYRTYSYVVGELPLIVAAHFPADPERTGISGHSMGGHGALVCAFKNPTRYRSVSAFAPIAAPTRSPWGQKAFSRYLGADEKTWKSYDASALVALGTIEPTILIDQGMADPYLEEQLRIDEFEQACAAIGQSLLLRRQEGYDHSYYFIASFIDDHLHHHVEALGR